MKARVLWSVTSASHIDHSVSRAQQRDLKLKLSVLGGKKLLEGFRFFFVIDFLMSVYFCPRIIFSILFSIGYKIFLSLGNAEARTTSDQSRHLGVTHLSSPLSPSRNQAL